MRTVSSADAGAAKQTKAARPNAAARIERNEIMTPPIACIAFHPASNQQHLDGPDPLESACGIWTQTWNAKPLTPSKRQMTHPRGTDGSSHYSLRVGLSSRCPD